MKVRTVPHLDDVQAGISGIHTVIRKLYRHMPKFGIEYVAREDDNFEVLNIHAGMGSKFPHGTPVVSSLHGLYWTADYNSLIWEWRSNVAVIDSLRNATEVTVPSQWVAESIQRDCRINPHILPHGIDCEEWEHSYPHEGYILAYAKNRVMDVCNPAFVNQLALRYPGKLFLCTFAPRDAPENVRVTGLLPPQKMKEVIQKAEVVISPIKETFGILQLEALASGTPVLGYNYGGNKDIITHGVNGYLAQPNSIEDLAAGLDYCMKYRDILSANARISAKAFTWDAVCEKLASIYRLAATPQPQGISVVIPSYNYSHSVSKAIDSVLAQTVPVKEIIVVDDGSTDDGATREVVSAYKDNPIPVIYHRQDNAGVAVARNRGISMATGKYIICLDADDQIATQFVEACYKDLEKYPTLGIAYTGLLAVEPDGKSTASPWPPAFKFDDMVYPGGINQIPTCCMFRRKIWERLGGFRSRYCPKGAGSEDAEFWLRAGLYGFWAKKVTEAPLFIYAYKSGRVSGDKTYREVDWRGLHPSTRDKQHPFMCVATPANGKPSHAVRQYDQPTISVIIPVSAGHKSLVVNALDSLESQTLRKWEVIVVDDSGGEGEWTYDGVPDILSAYPYVRMVKTPGKKGSGYARNRGAEAARADMIIFLDADDNFLVPDALESMLSVWNETGAAVYTDYISKAYINKEEAEKLEHSDRLLDYNNDGLAMHISRASDYECERAVEQPKNPLYIWNLITTLIPKAWHDEIGGFDEKMPSWEDWEYWLRMARAGKCFVRIPVPMVAYRFYTGTRRETGIQMPDKLLNYIIKKFKGVKTMPCKSCGGKTRAPAMPAVKTQAQTKVSNMNISDNDMVLITYENPNRGQHKVVGAQTKINYGYRAGGGVEHFYVHKLDIAAYPDWFTPYQPPEVKQVVPQASVPPTPPPVPRDQASSSPGTRPPAPIKAPSFVETKPARESSGSGQAPLVPVDQSDLQAIPGVTQKIAESLQTMGIKTWADIVELGEEGLLAVDGIGAKRASSIYSRALKMSGG